MTPDNLENSHIFRIENHKKFCGIKGSFCPQDIMNLKAYRPYMCRCKNLETWTDVKTLKTFFEQNGGGDEPVDHKKDSNEG